MWLPLVNHKSEEYNKIVDELCYSGIQRGHMGIAMVNGAATIGYMPKTSENSEQDRHKPSRMTRIPESLGCALDLVAANRLSTVTATAVDLLRDGLERLGAWPLSPDDIKKIHAAVDKDGKSDKDKLRAILIAVVARNRSK